MGHGGPGSSGSGPGSSGGSGPPGGGGGQGGGGGGTGGGGGGQGNTPDRNPGGPPGGPVGRSPGEGESGSGGGGGGKKSLKDLTQELSVDPFGPNPITDITIDRVPGSLSFRDASDLSFEAALKSITNPAVDEC